MNTTISSLRPGDPFRFDAADNGCYTYGHLIFANACRARAVLYDQSRAVVIEEKRHPKTGAILRPGRSFMTGGDEEVNLPLAMTVESLSDIATGEAVPPSPAPVPLRTVSLRPKEATMSNATIEVTADPKVKGLIARYTHQQKQAALASQTGDKAKQDAAKSRIAQLEVEAAELGVELPAYDSEPATAAAPTPTIEAAGKKGQEMAKVAAAKAKAAAAKTKGIEKGKAATKAERKVAKPKSTHNCLCGCGGETFGLYSPGHDARVKGILLKIERGDMEKADVPELVVPFVKWVGKHKTEGFKLTACPVKVPGRPEIENTTQKALEALDV